MSAEKDTDKKAEGDIETAWRKYFEVPRSLYELEQLVTGPGKLQEVYQERVLRILFTPHLKRLPFYFNLDGLKNGSLVLFTVINKDYPIPNFDPNTTDLAGKVVEEYISDLDSRLGQKPDATLGETRKLLNLAILRLLPKLSEGQAKSIFSHFRVNDFVLIHDWNGGDVELDPLEILFHNEEIPEFYKVLAANNVHAQILTEIQNGPKRHGHPIWSRRPSASTAERYTRLLSEIADYRDQPVSDGFWFSEVKFLLDNHVLVPIFDSNEFGKFIALAGNDKDTIYAFAARFIKAKKFASPFSEEEIAFANEMIDYLKDDPEAQIYLKGLLLEKEKLDKLRREAQIADSKRIRKEEDRIKGLFK